MKVEREHGSMMPQGRDSTRLKVMFANKSLQMQTVGSTQNLNALSSVQGGSHASSNEMA